MFGRRTAQKLDSAAAKFHQTGKKVAGERGGRAGDAIANATLGPIRARCNTSCTRSGCNHS